MRRLLSLSEIDDNASVVDLQACHTAAEDGILDAKDTQLAFSSALAQDCGPKVPDFHFESMYQHYESMYQLMHYESMVQYYESMN